MGECLDCVAVLVGQWDAVAGGVEPDAVGDEPHGVEPGAFVGREGLSDVDPCAHAFVPAFAQWLAQAGVGELADQAERVGARLELMLSRS